MDGQFVPNLTFGPAVIAAAQHTSLPFEAHHGADPDVMAAEYVQAGCCDRSCVEACTHLHRTLGHISSLGATAGVALNPATPAVVIANVLDLVDLVLVMTVNPGFGGQQYIAPMEPKITEVAELSERRAVAMTSMSKSTAASALTRSRLRRRAPTYWLPEAPCTAIRLVCNGCRLAPRQRRLPRLGRLGRFGVGVVDHDVVVREVLAATLHFRGTAAARPRARGGSNHGEQQQLHRRQHHQIANATAAGLRNALATDFFDVFNGPAPSVTSRR